MKSNKPLVSGPAVTLMIDLMVGMGLLLTVSHLALRFSDAILMHAREERLRGTVLAQSLAAGAWGATGASGATVIRHLEREAKKTLDGVRLDAISTDGEILHSTDLARIGKKVSIARLTFGGSEATLSGVSYTGSSQYEAAAVLHGPGGPEGYLLLAFESDTVARALASEITTDVIVGIVWLGALVLLSLPFVRHLTKPLSRLAADVTALGEGAYKDPEPLPSPIREVAVLQTRFAALAEALREKERENRSLLDQLRHQVDVVTRDLESANVFLRSVMKSLRSALVTTDRQGMVTSASESTARVVGPVDVGRPLLDQLGEPEKVGPALAKVIETGAPVRLELHPAHGQFLLVHLMPLEGADGERLGALARIEDISNQRKLEIQVARAERLSTVGEIAAGFAHEFGNAMHVVLGHGKILLSELPPDAPSRSDIALMVKESEQAATLVNRFKMFASPSRGKLLPIDVEAIVSDAAQVIEKEMQRHKVTFSLDAGKNIPEVPGDPALLRQAILNLFLNAVQAMPNGGQLSAKLTRTGEGGVTLTVSDTGTGIKPEDLPRIFDPFFTTKREGEGTGLGLSVVQTVVTLHGATIGVESELGRGTTFEISFPEPTEEGETKS